MNVVYTWHEGTQTQKPKEVDATSSSTVVYLRRNITRAYKEDEETGEREEYWKYEEAQLTPKQLEELVTLGVQVLEDSNSTLTDTVDVVLTEELPMQSEQIQTLADTVDDILTNVVPSIMEG